MQCKHHVLSGKGLFSTSWQACPQTVAPSGYHPHSYHNYQVILYQRQNYTFSQFHKPSAKIWRKRERNLLWREKILPLRRPWRFVYQWSWNCNFVCLSQKWWLDVYAQIGWQRCLWWWWWQGSRPARPAEPGTLKASLETTPAIASLTEGVTMSIIIIITMSSFHYYQRYNHAW